MRAYNLPYLLDIVLDDSVYYATRCLDIGNTRFFYISNQFISNQGSGFLKITIEYNGRLLC